MKPKKQDLELKVRCIKCKKYIELEFDDDGDPIGNVIAGDFRHSELFDDIVVPLNQGFMHMFCHHA